MLISAYSFSVSIIGKSKGRSAVASSAYITRSRMFDYEIGTSFDYTKNKSIALASAIITPDVCPTWATDAEKLWNNVQKTEHRKNAQLARSIIMSLPYQLPVEKMSELLHDFCKQVFASEGMIAQFALHQPNVEGGSDKRNYHAHILLTLRKVNEHEFCGNKVREWNHKDILNKWRKDWSMACSLMLRSQGLELEADRWLHQYLGLKKQLSKAIARGDIQYAQEACDREPGLHKGAAICALEKKGQFSYVLEGRLDAKKLRQEKIVQLKKEQQQIKAKEIVQGYLRDDLTRTR
jgi:hypothetical protein